VGLKRGPLSFVSTTEELLERKSRGSGPESREYGRRDPSRRQRGTLYPRNLALTSPSSGGRSVDIARSWTQATGFYTYIYIYMYIYIYIYEEKVYGFTVLRITLLLLVFLGAVSSYSLVGSTLVLREPVLVLILLWCCV
jgi:hypothetical protein